MKLNFLSYILLGICTGQIAVAENNAAMNCAKLADDDARLNCFDNVFSRDHEDSEAEQPPLDPVATTGRQWRLSEESSALDNRKDVWLSVQSKNTEGNAIGSPIRATLFLRCMENRTNLLISFDRYTTEDQSVRYKLDANPIQSQWMETMRGGDGIGVWSGGRAIPMIKGFFGHSALVLGYDTYTGPVEFEFDISGLEQRIEPLSSSCGWRP